jgi:hypothetical protein
MEIEVDYFKIYIYISTIQDNEKQKKSIENTKNQKKPRNNESEKYEGEITIKDCTNAIFKMKLNNASVLTQ